MALQCAISDQGWTVASTRVKVDGNFLPCRHSGSTLRQSHTNGGSIHTNILKTTFSPIVYRWWNIEQVRTVRSEKKYPIMAFFFVNMFVVWMWFKIAWYFSFGWALVAVERVSIVFPAYSREFFTIEKLFSLKWFFEKFTYANIRRVVFNSAREESSEREKTMKLKVSVAFTWNERKAEKC